LRGGSFPTLSFFIHQVTESSESDKNDDAQYHEYDAEISLSPKKRDFFGLSFAQLFLLLSAL